MIRLVLAAIRADARLTLAPSLVLAGAAALATIAFGIVETAASPGNQTELQGQPGVAATLAQIAVFGMILGIGLPTVAVVSGIVTTALAQERSTIASWRLAGARPYQVRLVMVGRVAATALLSGALGAVIGMPAVQPALEFLVSTTTFDVSLGVSVSPLVPAASLALVMLIAVLASLRPAAQAAGVPALEAVRDRREAPAGMGALRWVATVLLLLVAVASVIMTAVAGPEGASTLALISAFSFAAVAATAAPVLAPSLSRAWTGAFAAIPAPTWLVARSNALGRITTTTATVAPLALVLIVLASYFSCVQTLEVATSSPEQGTVNAQQGIVLLAPGAIIGLLGCAGVLIAVGGRRIRDSARLKTLGATPALLIKASLLEPAVYVGTALLMAIAPVTAIVLAFAVSIARSGLPFTPQVDAALIGVTIVAAYFVATAAVTASSWTTKGSVAELAQDA